ncbi:hypothetical protein SAMN02746065_11583 [Desulfocicer vacuolatum DSM 3385]|uniref:Uncharacterized protein n=1 Tax=Desulfocicer vacuolatum DSM 3385 TaxID=1121400 RepID=A0A1W2D589_9BACT|nr:hypothetical protein SAMN02746065_11583 [Desulfocicer vacuolatum DSM 3385]
MLNEFVLKWGILNELLLNINYPPYLKGWLLNMTTKRVLLSGISSMVCKTAWSDICVFDFQLWKKSFQGYEK